MEKEEGKKTNWFRRGIVIGVAAGSIYVLANKKARTKIKDSVSGCTEKTKHWIQVIKENREPFMEQMKASSERIATIVEEATDDIQTLVETSQHMKSHTQELLKALQESKDEFQAITTKLKNEEKLDLDEVVPSSDDEQLLQ
ncbi:gas vesicle protein [Evansella vedderi]|uniref:Gas vesicle protein n=1 Tax=Evansella vedderi TaxID=38282 RepID=A0ABT9ZUZ9_9BACI|nr:hypothetical protein [Evansella vedderi]MDQ0253960.1 gas vesicle protein [Evansella vedderi]